MKTSTKVIIGLIGAVVVFLLGFILGLNSAVDYYAMVLKISRTLTWVIPLLIVILIAVVVISVKRSKKQKEKREAFEAKAKAEME